MLKHLALFWRKPKKSFPKLSSADLAKIAFARLEKIGRETYVHPFGPENLLPEPVYDDARKCWVVEISWPMRPPRRADFEINDLTGLITAENLQGLTGGVR